MSAISAKDQRWKRRHNADSKHVPESNGKAGITDKVVEIDHGMLPAQVGLNLKCLTGDQEEKDGAEQAIQDHALLERGKDRQYVQDQDCPDHHGFSEQVRPALQSWSIQYIA